MSLLSKRSPLARAMYTVAAVTCLLAVLGAAPASAQHEDGHEHGHRRPECTEGYRHYPGTGRACRNENGNLNVPLDDGRVLETHGPDATPRNGDTFAAPAGKGGGKPSSGGGGTTPPPTYKGGACTSTGNRNELIYAVAHDDTDDYTARAPQIRQTFVEVDAYLNSEAGQFATQMHYRVLCDADGQPTVHKAILPTTSRTSFTFNSITSDLSRMGFNNPDVNYWVYFDESSPTTEARPTCVGSTKGG